MDISDGGEKLRWTGGGVEVHEKENESRNRKRKESSWPAICIRN